VPAPAGSALAFRAGRSRRSVGAPERGEPVLEDLAVLTPPLLVCVAFLVGLAAFLRHEMGRSRRHRDGDASGDISGNDMIPHSAASRAYERHDDATDRNLDDAADRDPIDDDARPTSRLRRVTAAFQIA
jgi:hypothetical protein